MRTFLQDEILDKLMTPEVVNLLTSIHEHKAKQDQVIADNPDILKAMQEVAKIQSAGASNRIAGLYTSNDRIEGLVNQRLSPVNGIEQEIIGYSKVLETINENYVVIKPTVHMILQRHEDLYSYTPYSFGGKWRETGSTFDIPITLGSLCKALMHSETQSKYDKLLLIPAFIIDFLCIRPFQDGNGRMSRLLMLLLLYRDGHNVGKYISIEKTIEETKETYYKVLQESSNNWSESTNDYSAFVKFYLEIILKSYQEFVRRVEFVQDKTLSKSKRIKQIFKSSNEELSLTNIVALCPDISPSLIRKVIVKLRNEGHILMVGTGRKTAYIRN